MQLLVRPSHFWQPVRENQVNYFTYLVRALGCAESYFDLGPILTFEAGL